MPKSVRETLTARIAVEMLVQGVDFSSSHVRELPASRSSATRILRALAGSGVIMNSSVRGKGKYRFTEEFLSAVSQDIAEGMPRGTFLHYPALRVFDVCRIGSWTEEELEAYVERLRKHWRIMSTRWGK
ncbi:MAG: hypothetical protein LYZ69_05480 [Nitrososphaerales archaeon]|nr:hypothetical protein [Nitrososphaerales archaeon]